MTANIIWKDIDEEHAESADGRWKIGRSNVNGWVVCRDYSKFISTKTRHYTIADAKAHAEEVAR
jgi:hypothetical protein